MASKNDDIEIKVKVDTSNVEKGMKDIEKTSKNTADKVAKNADRIEEAYEDVEKQFKDIAKQSKDMFKNMNISGFTSTMNKVKNQTKSAMKSVQSIISKALDTVHNIKVKATTDTSTSQSDKQGSSGVEASTVLAGGATGALLQSNLAKMKEGSYDVVKAVSEIGDSFRDVIKDSTKFSRQAKALQSAEAEYEAMAQSIREAGMEIGTFSDSIGQAYMTLQDAIMKASTSSKASIREVTDALSGFIGVLSLGGNNKLVRDLEKMEEYLIKISKHTRGSGDSPVNAQSVEKTNRQLTFLNGKAQDVMNTVQRIQNMSGKDKAKKLLGDTIIKVQDLKNAYLNAHPTIKKFYNSIGDSKAVQALKSIGTNAKEQLSKASEQFKKLGKEADDASKKVTKSSKNMQSGFKSLISSIAPMLSMVGIFSTLKTSITNAMESIETNNMFDTVFGDSANEMDAWIQKMNQTLGLGITDTKKYTATIMQMGKAMEMNTQQAMEMSQSFATMAGDMSSFYNVDLAQAQQDLQSALSGSNETLQKYGIILTEDKIKQDAYNYGIATMGAELTSAQRALTLTMMVERQLGVANGDLARSINSPANQLRILRANLYDLSVALGSCFMPILTVVLPILNRFVSALTSTINAVANFISQLFSLFGVSVGGGGGGSSSIGGGGGGGFLSDVADGVGSIGTALGDGLDSASNGAGAVADKLASGAESAKQMQKYLMGIDQINNIETDTDSGSSSPSGGGGGGSSSPSSGGGGVGGGGLGNMFDSLGDSAEDAKNKSKNELGEIADWIKDVANALKAIWGQLKAGWLSVADYINQSIANLKQAFSNLGSSIKDFLLGVWNNGGEQLVYNFGRLSGAIVGAILDISGQCVQMVANLFAYLNPDTNPYTRMFLDGLNNLLVACQNFALSVGSWFKTFVDNGGQAFLNVMGDIFMILGSIFTELLADAVNAITVFLNSWLGYTIISTVAITLDVIAGIIKALLIVVRECIPVIEAFALVFGGFALLKVKNDFTELFALLTKGHGDVKETKQRMEELKKTMGGNFATKIDNLRLKVGNLYDNFKKFTKDGLKNVGKEFDNCKKSMGKFGDNIKKVGKSALDFFNNIGKGAIKLVTFSSAQATGATTATAMAVAEGTATVATTGLTVATTALGIALAALGIGLIIAAIAGLIAIIRNWDSIVEVIKETFRKFFDYLKDKFSWVGTAIDLFKKHFETAYQVISWVWQGIKDAIAIVFDWLAEKFSWIGTACSWIADQFKWAWDKLKGFFGAKDVENNIEPEAEQTEESLNSLGDTIEETSDRFGTACSVINESLASIGIDSNKLALQLDEAEAMFDEKFSMISGGAREYLQAIAEGNEEALKEMAGSTDEYTAEIKQAFEDMSLEEQAIFTSTNGIIKGVNDDWADYTKGSYEECLFKFVAMQEQIRKDDSLTYDEKMKRLNSETEAFETAQQDKLNALNTTIAEMEKAEWQSEEDKYRAIQPYYEQRNQLIQQMEDYQLGSIDSVDEAVKQSAQAQEDAYDGVSNSQTEALEEVDTALEETKDNLSSFSEESEDTAKEIKKHWDGIGDDISNEFENALKGVGDNFKGILNNTKKQCQQLKSGLQATFSDMKIGVKKSMVEINSTITTKFTQAVNQVKTVANGFKTSLQTIFKGISSGLTTSINSIKTTMTNGFNSMSTSITSTMNSCKNTITNVLNNINTQVKSKTTTIKNTVSTTFNSLAKTFTSPFTSASTTISSSLATMNSTIATRLRTIVSTLQSYATKMKNTMNFNFPTPYLRMPHISVHGDWNFEKKTTPSFSVRWYSSGAIFNKRTILGNMGVGDAQNGVGNNPEAILPLDSLWKELNVQFQKQNQALKNNNQPIQVNLYLDGKVVTSTVIDNMKDQSKRGVLDTSWL